MGSYANFWTKEHDLVACANRKYFGYIDDEEYEKTRTYKFLKELSEDAAWMSNVSYIGDVIEMNYEQMMTFKKLYALDFFGPVNNSEQFEEFYELMWHDVLYSERISKRITATYILSFD